LVYNSPTNGWRIKEISQPMVGDLEKLNNPPRGWCPTSPHWRQQIEVRAYASVDWWGHQPRGEDLENII
jgi:hypothetical protein